MDVTWVGNRGEKAAKPRLWRGLSRWAGHCVLSLSPDSEGTMEEQGVKNQEENLFPEKRSCEPIIPHGSMPAPVFPTAFTF